MDVTGRVKLQEKLVHAEGLKTISEVSARLAHEIRNPLVSAGGFARRLLSSLSQDDPNRAKVEIILKEIGRLEMILRMILSYLQPVEISKAPTDPYRLIEAALHSVAVELIRERNVDLDLRLLSDVKEISLDPLQMEQAIGVLIKCALSRMREGGTLSLSAASQGDRLMLAMRYPVEHMAQDDVRHFFYPFAPCGAASEIIDLPMSKIIIEKHGGTIDVKLDSAKELYLELSLPLVT